MEINDQPHAPAVEEIFPGSSVTRLWVGGRGSIHDRGRDFLSSPPRPMRLWGLPGLLSNGYRRIFPRW